MLAAASLLGCPDPQGALDDFESRIPDARVVVQYDAAVVSEVPDISGTALLAIYVPIVDTTLQGRAQITLTPVGEGASFDITLTLLTANAARTPTGTPVTVTGVAVDNTASFTINIPSLDIPPEANPLGNPVTATNIKLTGTIRGTDSSCGTVSGMANAGGVNVPLDGSTFASKRVAAGATGDALGDPVVKCP